MTKSVAANNSAAYTVETTGFPFTEFLDSPLLFSVVDFTLAVMINRPFYIRLQPYILQWSISRETVSHVTFSTAKLFHSVHFLSALPFSFQISVVVRVFQTIPHVSADSCNRCVQSGEWGAALSDIISHHISLPKPTGYFALEWIEKAEIFWTENAMTGGKIWNEKTREFKGSGSGDHPKMTCGLFQCTCDSN